MSTSEGHARDHEGGPGTYDARPRRNGMGVAALIFGIVSLVLAILILFAPIAFLLGIVAVILGAVGIRRASRGDADNRGQAIAGLITGLLAVLVAIVIGVGFITFFTQNQGDLRRLGTCMSSGDNDADRAACLRRFSDRLEK